MKIFLCFSSVDRYTIVDSILYHLKKFHIPVWYDYHELTLGDNRITGNFEFGLDLCNYAIVIISPAMFQCKCGNDELVEIKRRYQNNTIHVFPIFYEITASDLPDQYKWLTNLIYNELNQTTGSLATCKQIVYQIVKDQLATCKIKHLREFESSSDYYICNALNTYLKTDEDNFNGRFAILYMTYIYLITQNIKISDMHVGIMERLCQITKLNITFPHKEMLIAETILTILLNEYNH
jgi:hypothetical protein